MDSVAPLSRWTKRLNCLVSAAALFAAKTTATAVAATQPFRSRPELIAAVDRYLDAVSVGTTDSDLERLYGPIEQWDVSSIARFEQLFSHRRNSRAAVFNADISRWNVSRALLLNDMFLGAQAFDQDLSAWGPQVRNVIKFNGLFEKATSFQGTGLDQWDVSSGQLFMVMFAETTSLQASLDLSRWNVSKAERMDKMFRNSNFGSSLCRWATRLSPAVRTDQMLMNTDNCLNQHVPDLQSTEPISTFCATCQTVSLMPSSATTEQQTSRPIVEQTAPPTRSPTQSPSYASTIEPTVEPTAESTNALTDLPTTEPKTVPTYKPTDQPTTELKAADTATPFSGSTAQPTTGPTTRRTAGPSIPLLPIPTTVPTQGHTESQIGAPTEVGDSSNLPIEVTSPVHAHAVVPNYDFLLYAVDQYLNNSAEYYNDILPTYGRIEDWDVSRVKRFNSLFGVHRNANAATFSADLSRWNVSSSVSFSDMFLGADMVDFDVSLWGDQVRNARRFNGMFERATSFRGQGLERWDVSSGELFMVMFAETKSMAETDMSGWNMSAAKNLLAMFRSSTFSGSLCNWTTTLPKDAIVDHMLFKSNCINRSDPDLSQPYLEAFCSPCARQPTASRAPTASPTDEVTFGKPRYEPIPGTEFLRSAVDSYLANDKHYREIVAVYGSIENWDVSKVRSFDSLFSAKRNARAATFNADLSRWSTDSAIYMRRMFDGASAFDSDLGNFKTGQVQRFNGMFQSATSFRGRGLELWNVSSAVSFDIMFASADNLDLLDIRDWSPGNAQSFKAMFRASNFGSNKTTSNLCSWLGRLAINANIDFMFHSAHCPYSRTPKLFHPESRAIYTMCQSCIPGPAVPDLASKRPVQQPYDASRPNVLFIIVDQQRFDAIGSVQNDLAHYDGKLKVRTPNLDKLIKSGVHFRNAYCQCSVCGPARATLRTGCSVERTGVQSNNLASGVKEEHLFQSRIQQLVGLDQVLVEEYGYVSEYFGKWHLPPTLQQTRGNPSEPQNVIVVNEYDHAKKVFEFDNSVSSSTRFRRNLRYYETIGAISKKLHHLNEQLDTYTGYPYIPIQLDSRFGAPQGTWLNGQFSSYERSEPSQAGNYSLPEYYTPSAFTGNASILALTRLVSQCRPFLLTASFHSPHAPMIPAWKYLRYYWENRDNLLTPPSINDDLIGSAYTNRNDVLHGYADVEKVKEWTATYYALVEEIDDYVGMLLDALGDALNNTLVIFTSDHGEMLGAHGKREKNNFYEESARVPLIMSFPGRIPRNRSLDSAVSHLDVFATILDYVNASRSDHSDGRSLMPLIDGRSHNADFDEDVVVAEWDHRSPSNGQLSGTIDSRPAFMVRKGKYKLMIQKQASSEKLDMLYDLQKDPFEIDNLVGRSGMSADSGTIRTAEHLRCLLLEWMERMDGSNGEAYYSHPLANFGETDGDIIEVQRRQSWRALDFWVSAASLSFGDFAWNGTHWRRNEFLYIGSRTNVTLCSPITDRSDPAAPSKCQHNIILDLTGPNSRFFGLDVRTMAVHPMECNRVKVSFVAASTDFHATTSKPNDAAVNFGISNYPEAAAPTAAASIHVKDGSTLAMIAIVELRLEGITSL